MATSAAVAFALGDLGTDELIDETTAPSPSNMTALVGPTIVGDGSTASIITYDQTSRDGQVRYECLDVVLREDGDAIGTTGGCMRGDFRRAAARASKQLVAFTGTVQSTRASVAYQVVGGFVACADCHVSIELSDRTQVPAAQSDGFFLAVREVDALAGAFPSAELDTVAAVDQGRPEPFDAVILDRADGSRLRRVSLGEL